MGAFLLCLLSIFLASSNALRLFGFDGPIVNTTYGPIQGVQSEGVFQFLGVPFAQPPVGNLRWQPPQAAKKWSQVCCSLFCFLFIIMKFL
jgi:para-nitrobenzyl esterase